MSPESPWQGCHGGRELARQGRTGQDTCKQPMAEPCPPSVQTELRTPWKHDQSPSDFFCQMIKSSGHEVFLTTTVNSVDLNLIRTSACYRFTCIPVFCSEMSTCTIRIIFSEFLKDKIVE